MVHKISAFDNINFNGGNLSSDGGAILLLQFLNQIGFDELIKSIPYCDSRKFRIHSNTSILLQLIYKKLLGYFSQKDQSVLKDDPLLSKFSFACSQPTVSRFFDRVSNVTNAFFKELMTKQACEYVNRNVKNIILDVDSTFVGTNGKQEASSYIHHYGEVGYHPLVINEYNSKLLLSALLRTGSSYSSNGIVEELKTVFEYLDNNSDIKFRGDSAFYRTDLFEYLEENSVTYYIRAKNFKSLKQETLEDMIINKIDWNDFDHTNPYYGEIQYKVGTSDKKRRLIYKVFNTTEDGTISLLPVIYCVITNDKTSTPEEVMRFYEARGNSENFTKELKDDFDASTLSHRGFSKNEMEFLISCISYNLYHIFQETILEGEDKKIRMNTFRLRYQKIAVKVVKHARSISLSFSSAYRNQSQFLKYWNLVLQI